MKWLKLFLALVKMRPMEHIEVAGENFPVQDVEWVSICQYFTIEYSEPDENGFMSEKKIPMIFISGKFGHREIIAIEPHISQAGQLKNAIVNLKKMKNG